MIAFDFDGDYTGAFRDIPLRDGETIDQIAVSEGDTAYTPGGCAELGCSSPPGTFGTADIDDGIRIVWHYRASFEQKRFRVAYRLRGVAIAYDDVVDVNLKVWGDEWEVELDQLTSTLIAPGEIVRAWGHPVAVRGDVTLDGDRAELRAIDIPAGQFVELRALIPRRVFTSTAGMKTASGPGLEAIAAEERADAADYEQNQRKIDDALDHLPRTIALLLPLALGPGAARDRRSSGCSTAASAGRPTTASTSRSRRPRRRPLSFRRCSPRAARPARSSSRRRCST